MRRTAHGPLGLLALALVLATVLVGCAPGPEPSAPTTTAPAPSIPAAALPRFTVEIRQNRASWAERVVEVRIGTPDTGDDGDVVVHGVRLTAPSVEGVAASDPQWERRVPAGGAREAPVALGEPVCPPRDGTPVVEVDVRDAAGREGTVRAVPADPRGHLHRIAGEDCAAQAVAAGLRLAFLPHLEVGGTGRDTRATLRLELDPVPGGPDVAVHRVDGTVLVSPADGTSWQLPDAPVAPPGRTCAASSTTWSAGSAAGEPHRPAAPGDAP